MNGIIRFYDNYQINRSRGVHNHGADVLKLALLTPAYSPCPSYGTRGAMLTQEVGDVVYSTAYRCFFVATVSGLTALGTPIFDPTLGALTEDGGVTWQSLGLAPPSTHAVFSDVSASEITDADYIAGGLVLNTTLSLIGRRTVLGCQPTAFPSATISAKYAVIYSAGTFGALVNPLIAYILLDSAGGTMQSFSGDFRVRFNNDIIYSLGGW